MTTIILSKPTWVQGRHAPKGQLVCSEEIAEELRLLGYVEGQPGFTFAQKASPGFTGKFQRVIQK